MQTLHEPGSPICALVLCGLSFPPDLLKQFNQICVCLVQYLFIIQVEYDFMTSTLTVTVLEAKVTIRIVRILSRLSGPGPSSHGHWGHFGPLCQGLPASRQKQKIRDKSSQKNSQPSL